MIMLTFVLPELPEEIQHQEDWINRTLNADYPGWHVCLHADTTVTHGPGTARLECDYCPAAVTVTEYDPFPLLTPWYFTPEGSVG